MMSLFNIIIHKCCCTTFVYWNYKVNYKIFNLVYVTNIGDVACQDPCGALKYSKRLKYSRDSSIAS